MITDTLPPEIPKKTIVSENNTSNYLKKLSKQQQPPSLSIIDLSPRNNNQKHDQNQNQQPTPPPTKSNKSQINIPPQEMCALESTHKKSPLCVLNLADGLDLTANPMNTSKKSSLPLQRKTLEWVINKSEQIEKLQFLTRPKTPVVFKQDFNFDKINESEMISKIPYFLQNHNNINSNILNRTGLGSAFSSIPWCYNSESAQPNKLPADNAIMPDQLYVKSVKNLCKNQHRTGISRPSSKMQAKEGGERDEIEELKRMSKTVLHQAIREAVGLGLMTVEESRILLKVINEEKKQVLLQNKNNSTSASNPISDPGQHYANQESEGGENNNNNEQKPNNRPPVMHNVGIVDPGVGFEPVEVEWIKPTENEQHDVKHMVKNALNIEKEVRIDDNDPDVCIIGELGPDQLKDCDSFRENENNLIDETNSDNDEKDGCVARPSTAR